MSKGEETKEKILQQAAELFNQQGYAGASISDGCVAKKRNSRW